MYTCMCVCVALTYIILTCVVLVRGRGGDRKVKDRADGEDMVMEMDIDPSTGTVKNVIK